MSQALLFFLLAGGALDPSADRLDLICVGGGSANVYDGRSVTLRDNSGNSAHGESYGTRDVAFGDQVNLWVANGKGSVRLPRVMLPPLRGGKNGWFDIKNVKITDSEITGSVAVNPLNSPKIRIDRNTGSINISGKAGNYSGSCKRFDPSVVERAF